MTLTWVFRSRAGSSICLRSELPASRTVYLLSERRPAIICTLRAATIGELGSTDIRPFEGQKRQIRVGRPTVLPVSAAPPLPPGAG
ncbi:hypothetical protein [Streptomyces sp. NPDC056227]|uniref:hypothetical protein n=1 Tax=Streptomyces sp. NPDC056227 TaxID=3345753 RepID=UPI0035DB739C